ncbi:methyltransferase domain-containing protein [Rathayibacter sp. VKM Ac-2803]|uniref:class I SAM-dependent methyltransferase n=1 Tax=Rathayibacter sp. VKM Ac-2803 TaxID=2609256 RepID=UPI0013583345|nr:class I SAM-dependent methyltransferase [Rathayibacter sp. VKM Ac-2803]MWV48001.1 methyltransferase domain-containing protein [Rathayibacter sp. VKM Ac-2803]
MTDERVAEAYGARAAEYAALLGSVEELDGRDRALIASWAASLDGPVVDAGCGPGHWTALLHELGVDVVGVDLVPEFLEHARAAFPGVPFRRGSLRDPEARDASLGGILAWYSLIHLPPEELPAVLEGFAARLAPGGRLLVGFFEGPTVEAFDHAVTTAWFHPLDELATAVEAAGLDVVHRARRSTPGLRDHGELLAVRR